MSDTATSRTATTAHRLRADARSLVCAAPTAPAALDLLLCDVAFGDREPADLRADLGRAVELFRSARGAGPWLYGGAAQLGWVTTRLGWTPPAAVDRAVEDWVGAFPADADADLPRGLLGLGLYALHHPDRSWAARLTAGVLDVLDRRAEHDGDGMFVRVADTPFHRATGQAGHRLVGAAHGAAGLLAYLSAVVAAGLPGTSRAAALRADAGRWLLARRGRVGGSEFPRSVATADVETRSAWCHGDPGVWLGLDAARDSDAARDPLDGSGPPHDPETARVADTTARAVVSRPPEEAGVLDGSLCHGAAGLVWIGTRIAERAGRAAPSGARPAPSPEGTAVDADAARRFTDGWARRIDDLREQGPLRYVVGPAGPERSASLLDGDVGVALALHRRDVPGSGRAWEPLLWG